MDRTKVSSESNAIVSTNSNADSTQSTSPITHPELCNYQSYDNGNWSLEMHKWDEIDDNNLHFVDFFYRTNYSYPNFVRDTFVELKEQLIKTTSPYISIRNLKETKETLHFLDFFTKIQNIKRLIEPIQYDFGYLNSLPTLHKGYYEQCKNEMRKYSKSVLDFFFIYVGRLSYY